MMPEFATLRPSRRPELVVRPLGENGQYVVKDPHTGAYYHLGEEEHFLLTQLDGQQSAEVLCAAFAERFGQPLAEEELDEFVEMARANGFLQSAEEETGHNGAATLRLVGGAAALEGVGGVAPAPRVAGSARSRQSILHWRIALFGPDRLFTWLAPKLWFCWTRTFLLLSAGCILVAAVLVWANGQELVSYFAQSLRWETAVLVWLTLAVVTTCHEFAHGLTCKHHG